MSKKKIIIIGGSGSIGSSIANEIIKDGFEPHLIGRNSFSIAIRHILPNISASILVIATISLALAIISEATLSFLGVVIGKISNDIYMLMQQSIDELSEKQGKNQIGSSSMPHKVNAYTIYQVLRDASLLRGKASGLSDSALTLFEGDSKNDFVLEEILKDSLILSFNLLKNFNLLLSKLIINKKKIYSFICRVVYWRTFSKFYYIY